MFGRFPLLQALAVVALCQSTPTLASWIPNGITAAPSDGAQANPVLLSDGLGGAYVLLEGSGGTRIWAQRLDVTGSAASGWPAAGLPLDPGSGEEPGGVAHPFFTVGPDGDAYTANGGLFSGSVVTVNRLAREGVLRWPTGVALSAVPYEPNEITGIEWAAPFEPAKGPGNFFPTLAPDGAGGVLVAWEYVSLSSQMVFVQRVGSDGIRGWRPGGLKLANPGFSSVVCSDGAGGAYVAWTTYANAWDIVLQHVLASGEIDPAWPHEGLAVGSQGGRQSNPSVVADGAGGCLVFWQDEREAGTSQIFANHVRVDGTRVPGWPADGASICSQRAAPGIERPGMFAGTRQYFSAIEDGAGGAFICWTDRRAGAADVYALRMRGEGGPASGWLENGTPVCRAAGDQDRPTLAADGAGGIYVTWQDARSGEFDIYVQRLTAAGSRADGWADEGFAICAAPGNQRTPVITASGDANAIVAWTDERGPVSQVYVHRFSADALVPVLASFVRAEIDHDFVRLEWRIIGDPVELTIFRSARGETYRAVGRARAGAEGRVVFEDRDVTAGATYRYRIGESADPDQAAGDASVTVPLESSFAFEGLAPHPARLDRLRLAFTAPRAGTARVEIFEITGRRTHARELVVAAGRQVTPIEASGLRPGVWLLRLTIDGASIARRVCVLE